MSLTRIICAYCGSGFVEPSDGSINCPKCGAPFVEREVSPTGKQKATKVYPVRSASASHSHEHASYSSSLSASPSASFSASPSVSPSLPSEDDEDAYSSQFITVKKQASFLERLAKRLRDG